MENTIVFVPTYHAEKTITNVLSDTLKFSRPCRVKEILVIDDRSTDGTFNIVKKIRKGYKNMTIIRNEQNLGYGGNLKKGLDYAIKKNYSILITLHGDGQYFPKEMHNLLDKIAASPDIALVIGSRFNENLLNSNMPYYKRIGNKILTFILNLVCNTSFSETHSGFRAYRLCFVKKINYSKFSNDHLFDTQILCDLISKGYKVLETNCSTIYNANTRSMSFLDDCNYALGIFAYLVSNSIKGLK